MSSLHKNHLNFLCVVLVLTHVVKPVAERVDDSDMHPCIALCRDFMLHIHITLPELVELASTENIPL